MKEEGDGFDSAHCNTLFKVISMGRDMNVLHLLCEWGILCHQKSVTIFYLQHTSGLHVPLGNSDVLAHDFSSVRLPT
jgi:hypothetical protein